MQYLSQQFVDTLCSAEGLTDELLAEIERVIYQAHDPEDRMGTTSFRELLDFRAARGRSMRQRHEEALLEASVNLTTERERRARLPILQRQRKEAVASIDKDKRDRSTLIGRGSEERTKRLDEVSTAAEAVRFRAEQNRRQRQALLALKDEVFDTRRNKAPAQLRRLQQVHQEIRLSRDHARRRRHPRRCLCRFHPRIHAAGADRGGDRGDLDGDAEQVERRAARAARSGVRGARGVILVAGG